MLPKYIKEGSYVLYNGEKRYVHFIYETGVSLSLIDYEDVEEDFVTPFNEISEYIENTNS